MTRLASHRLRHWFEWTALAIAAISVAVFAVLPYLAFDARTSRVPINPTYAWHMPVLSSHAIMGGLALLLGPLQFVAALRQRYPLVHRTLGGIYLFCVLVGSILGIVSSLASTSGLAAQLAFLLLAGAWFYSGLKAFVAIRRRQVALHRIWMIRNYALTFAAVLLRVFVAAGLLFMQSHPATPFEDVYTSSVWCSILVSLIVAEWVMVQRTLAALAGAPKRPDARAVVPA